MPTLRCIGHIARNYIRGQAVQGSSDQRIQSEMETNYTITHTHTHTFRLNTQQRVHVCIGLLHAARTRCNALRRSWALGPGTQMKISSCSFSLGQYKATGLDIIPGAHLVMNANLEISRRGARIQESRPSPRRPHRESEAPRGRAYLSRLNLRRLAVVLPEAYSNVHNCRLRSFCTACRKEANTSFP